MSKKIDDNIFGKMDYNYSWVKKDNLDFFGKEYAVKVIAQAYEGDNILESQRTNYQNYKKFLEEHDKEIIDKLKNYCKDICNRDILLGECLRPDALIFERDGSWGILFESECDIENGVALFVKDSKIYVGPQNEFL